MLLARWSALAAMAISPVAAGFVPLLLAAMQTPALAATCPEVADLTILSSPMAPWKGAPLRIMVATEKPVEGTLSLTAPDGSVAATSPDRHGGEPYSWFAEVATPATGTWHATLASDGCAPVAREVVVSAQKPQSPQTPAGRIWQVRGSWNSTMELLFSAWIEKLFDAPPDQDLSWKAWHEVLKDQSRNFLFNYLGRNEDNVTVSLRPDCADFVYFLRAYFAFKMGLPFGYSNCSRGTGGKPPKCYQWFDIDHPEVTRPAPPPEQDVAPTVAAAAPAAEDQGVLGIFTRRNRRRSAGKSAHGKAGATETQAPNDVWRVFA